MHAGALRALEFDRIVAVVRGFAQTPQGEARLAELQPATDPKTVAAALAATSETVRFLAGASIAVQAPPELESVLGGLMVEGRPLEPLQLVALASFLSTVESTANAVRRARASFPILHAIVERTASFEREIADIRRKIDPSGEVLDDASPELRSIRDRLQAAARAAARHARVVPARQGHRQVPPAADRHRSPWPVRAGRSRRAPGVDPRHRARQLGQRRQSLSRTPQHRRNQQRHRRAGAAGSTKKSCASCWR